MEPGLLVLIGVFTLAAVSALWNFSYRRSLERRLAEKGFELCDAEAPALESAWRALTRCDGSTELRLDHCRRRGSGRGTLYHFTVRQRPVDSDPDRNPPGASYPAYRFDVHDPAELSRGAVTNWRSGSSRPQAVPAISPRVAPLSRFSIQTRHPA